MTMYKQDPDNSKKQIPKPLLKTSRNRAITPNIVEQYANANHIYINQSGSYFFRYDCTGSAGDTITDGYELGLAVSRFTVTGLPIKLDINPCAWSGSSALGANGKPVSKTGDVTFVYRGQ